MTYKLIDLARNKHETAYETQFEALNAAMKNAYFKAIYGDSQIHLSVIDNRNRQLVDLKITQREEVQQK